MCKKRTMHYRTGQIVGIVVIILGLALLGISIEVFQSEINIGTILSIGVIITGVLIDFIFYRCPHCGAMLPARLILKYCPTCGKKLE